jgi:hypothetical protein
MEVDARISKAWRKRMLFMLIMISGIAAWFLTDGYYIWPNEAERYAAYTEIKDTLIAEGKAEDEESSSVRLAWQRHAKEVGYTAKVPKERTDGDIREQLVIGWTMAAGCLMYGLWIAWNHTLRVRTEGDVVIGTSGQRVKLDAIIKIDRKKWKDKGIAYAIYEDGGKERRLTLDDHKFQGCEEIVLEAERLIKVRKDGSEGSEDSEGS